jgi:hypothetical protein
VTTTCGSDHVGRCTDGPTATRDEIVHKLENELGFVLRMPAAEYARGGTPDQPALRGRLCWQPDSCHPDQKNAGTRFWLQQPHRQGDLEVWPNLDPRLEGRATTAAITVIAEPYDARQCPVCKAWIYTAVGPFAEDNDPTKTLADYEHWATEHATEDQLSNFVIRYPYFDYNDQPVEAQYMPQEPGVPPDARGPHPPLPLDRHHPHARHEGSGCPPTRVEGEGPKPMRRPSYRQAVAWISENDEPTDLTAERVADLISTCLIADLFGIDPARVAGDVVRYRKRKG